MTSVTIYDHILIAVLAVGWPVHGFLTFKSFLRDVRKGVPRIRERCYLETISIEWGLAIIVLAAWLAQGRSLLDLGFGIETHWQMWLGAGLTIVAVGLIVWQLRGVARSAEARSSAARQLADYEVMLPHTRRESRLFAVLSVTAGVCEEILHRAFLLAYLSLFMPVWAAAALAIVLFGLGHAYQAQLTGGPSGIFKTAVFGAVGMGLYLLTGSLWCSIVLHAAVDLQAGYLAELIYVRHPDEREGAAVEGTSQPGIESQSGGEDRANSIHHASAPATG